MGEEMKTKQTKTQKIAELERKLEEALAGQAYVYNFAALSLAKASTDHLLGSGVVIKMYALGGKELLQPVLIRDGLSRETIEALRNDLKRSYDLATAFKPKG